MELINFSLSDEYIELIKLLKLLNLVESGADAKIAVNDGLVTCNDAIEFRKRKKLIAGDCIIYMNNKICIV